MKVLPVILSLLLIIAAAVSLPKNIDCKNCQLDRDKNCVTLSTTKSTVKCGQECFIFEGFRKVFRGCDEALKSPKGQEITESFMDGFSKACGITACNMIYKAGKAALRARG